VLTTAAERRATFESFVRNRSMEEKNEKKAKITSLQDDFRKLMDEYSDKITHRTSYSDFCDLVRHDARYKALESKERETIFAERVNPLREKHKQSTLSSH
jgi:hypothetical protein